jgi:hypothetical protein
MYSFIVAGRFFAMLVSSLEIYADCPPNGWVQPPPGCGKEPPLQGQL